MHVVQQINVCGGKNFLKLYPNRGEDGTKKAAPEDRTEHTPDITSFIQRKLF